MEKIFGIGEKRELCRKIADAYRQKANDGFDAAIKAPGKVGGAFREAGLSGESATYIGGLSFLGYAMFSAKDKKQAKKYEELATSKLLYFKTKSGLQKVLKELPGKKEISIPL